MACYPPLPSSGTIRIRYPCMGDQSARSARIYAVA